MTRHSLISGLLRLATLVVLFVATFAAAADFSYLVYVGTYTDKGSKGIYAYRFDPRTGESQSIGPVAETDNPSFLAVSADNKYLYAVNETDHFDGDRAGAISTYAIDRSSGKLTLMQQISSLGADPAHLSLDRTGRYLLVANYTSGNIASFPIANNGTLGQRSSFVQHAGFSVNKERQTGPHAHEIQASKDNRFVFVPDLGLDELLVYRFESESGALSPNSPAFVKVSPGSGPRHLAITPSGRFVYLVNELSSTVIVFSYQADSGQLRELQTISTLPPGFKGENTTAEIAVDAKGKFLYVSNRGDDSIAVFDVNQRDGKLAFVERVPTGGKTPRHFTLDPTGRWLFAENQDSGTVNLFSVDPANGRLTATSHSLNVTSPVCVVFVPLK